MPFLSLRSLFGIRERLLLVLLVVLPFSLSAQTVTSGSRSQEEQSILKRTETANPLSNLSRDLPPVERPVDANLYRMGPNDQLILSLPLMEPGEFPLVVSIDNTLLLPRGFALVNVEGMTLARLRQTVDSLFRARSSSYRNVGLSLVRPRSIYVNVSGNVLSPGRLVLTAADRVTTAIDIANTVSEDVPTEQREALLKQRMRMNKQDGLDYGGLAGGAMPQRWVTLRHNDGTSERVDLIRYRALGNQADNPTLREGDEVIVHSFDPSTARIAVSGAVNSPMMIPYSAGDNALLLARLGSGARSGTGAETAYISRVSSAGLERIEVNLTDTAALAAITLMPGDQLVVEMGSAAVTGGRGTGVVAVIGEVMRPSTYPVIPGTTRLSEVIQQAGGFTSDAALNGAYIRRPGDGRTYRRDLRHADPGAVIATSTLTLDDTTRMKHDMADQFDRVAADFVAIFEGGNRAKDVPLENGDEIVVPATPRQVFVRGRVTFPGWVPYMPGSDFETYVELAGGFTDAAVPGRAQVLKYGTGIWEDPSDTRILPGDEIYIPGERDVPARTSLEVASTIISITSGIVALVSSIYSFVQALERDNP